ncbi:hypothetical protein pb186bvf_004553 [Paramecium bursaria]
MGLYNMFVINSMSVIGQNQETSLQFMISLVNLILTFLSNILSCYIIRKLRLVSYCDILFIPQTTFIITSYLYFQAYTKQMAYFKILVLAFDRFIKIAESIIYIQYKYEWQGIYFAFEQCKNVSFLLVFFQVMSSFSLYNNQNIVLYILLSNIPTFVIAKSMSHYIYQTGTILKNQNYFPYMLSMMNFYENQKSSLLCIILRYQHFSQCQKCKLKYKRIGVKRITKCLFEQLILFKQNEVNFMLFVDHVHLNQKQPMLSYVQLKKYYCSNDNLSMYFKIKQFVVSEYLQIQINQAKVVQRHFDEIQINRNTFEETLKFNQIQLKVIPQIIKITNHKIELWQLQIKGFQDIYEFQQECIKICELIVRLRKDLEQLLKIDLKELKAFTNIKNLFTLKYLSLYYTIIMNDFKRGLQVEYQYWQIFQAEIGYSNLELNPLFVLEDKMCILDISMIKNLGHITNDKKDILNFFNYNINDSILIKNVNELLPPFLDTHHHNQLEKFISVGHSESFQKFKLLFGQSKQGFIIPFEMKLINNFRFTEDFILTGVLVQNNKNEFVIFNNQGTILGITQKLFNLIQQQDSHYSQFIRSIGINQLFPNISQVTNKLEYQLQEDPISYIEDEQILTIKSNFFQFGNSQENKYSNNQFQTFFDTHRGQMDEKLLKQKTEYFEKEDYLNSGMVEQANQISNLHQNEQSYQTKFKLTQQKYYGSNYFYSMEILELRSISNVITQFPKSNQKLNQSQLKPQEKQSVSSTQTKNSQQSSQQIIRDFQNQTTMHKNVKLIVVLNLLIICCLITFISLQITNYKKAQDKTNFNTQLLEGPIVFNRFFDQVICVTWILCAQATNLLNSSQYRIQQTLDELVKLDNYIFGNMSKLYDTFIYIEQSGYISSVIIDLGLLPSENATYTKFVSILLANSKIVFKAGQLRPDQINQILNTNFLDKLLSIRFNIRNLYLMNQQIINSIYILFQNDFYSSEQQNLNILLLQISLISSLIITQLYILNQLEIHNQKIIQLIGRSTEELIIEQIIIYQDIQSKLNDLDHKGWKQSQFSHIFNSEQKSSQKQYSLKNQKNKQSQLHSRIKVENVNLNKHIVTLLSYLVIILLFSIGGFIILKTQHNNLEPIQNLNLNYALFTTQLDSLISASIIQKLQPQIFNELIKRKIYNRAQLDSLSNARIFVVWKALYKNYYDYFSKIYEGTIQLKYQSPSNYDILEQLFTGDLCKISDIRFCNLNNMSQSQFISKYGQFDITDDIRQYVNSGIQGIIDQVQQSIAQDFIYEQKNNLYSSNLDELSQLVNTKEFNHVYINHFTDSYNAIKQFLIILEQTTKDQIFQNFYSFTLYMIIVGFLLLLFIIIALFYQVRRTQSRIKHLKMSILLMPYEQQVTPQAISILKQIK